MSPMACLRIAFDDLALTIGPARHSSDHAPTRTGMAQRNSAVLAQYAHHYNYHRPHQARRQRPPLHKPGQTIDITARIKSRQAVCGLISEYRRAG
jgi:hypothetical protein